MSSEIRKPLLSLGRPLFCLFLRSYGTTQMEYPQETNAPSPFTPAQQAEQFLNHHHWTDRRSLSFPLSFSGRHHLHGL